MFSDVLDAVKLLGTAITGARRLGDEDRKKLADLSDDISETLNRFVDAGTDRRTSINLCAELREYVSPLHGLAAGRLPSDEIKRVAAALDNVCDSWSAVHASLEMGQPPTDRDLNEIVAAAGTFRGLANRIRAT